MNIIVRQIGQSQDILGGHIDHLAKNPRDFLALMTLDMNLAMQYAQSFSAGHALTLFSTAQAQGIQVIQEILSVNPSAIALSKESLGFEKMHQADLETRAIEITDQTTAATSSVFAWPDDNYDKYQSDYYYHGKMIFQKTWDTNNQSEFSFEHNVAFELAYKQFTHPQWVNTQKSRVLAGLLSKLDSSVYFVDNARRRVGVLDAEFTDTSTFSRLFKRSDNIFNHLIQTHDYILMGKMISLLSPNIAVRELAKPRQGHTNVLALIVEHIPSARQATVDVISKLQELPNRMFETAIVSFGFNVLKSIKDHCENLARSFYEIAPAFMQRQFPQTAIDLPPPYEAAPAYNKVV